MRKIISGIYCITNKVNGKAIVGHSFDIFGRWLKYRSELRRNVWNNAHLQASWNKYGEENFIFSIIEQVPKNKTLLAEREDYWVDLLETKDRTKGYNKADPIESNLGIQHTDEWKKMMSARNSGENNPFFGKTHTKETVESLSGENNATAKLSNRDVFEIVDLYSSGNFTQVELAKMFEIHSATISQIIQGNNWKHLVIDLGKLQEIGKHNKKKRLLTEKNKGSNNPMSKLKQEQVFQIHLMYSSGMFSMKKIGEKFGVHTMTINDILCGKLWKDVFCQVDTSRYKQIASKNKKNKFDGVSNPKNKLSLCDVKKIRELYLLGELTQTALSKRFGVSISTINSIVKNRTWKEE